MVTIEFLRFAAMFVIFATLWRVLTTKFAASNNGTLHTASNAMAFVL